jgi:hypothetical protein
VLRATKSDLTVAIYDRLGRGNLALHAKGGVSGPKTARRFAIPSPEIRRGARGVVSRDKVRALIDRYPRRSLRVTKTGTAMRAVSFNHQTAALMGINVGAIVSLTFVLGSMFAAAAGFLYAMKYPQLNQTASSIWVLLGLKAFVAAVVGGIGNIRGAMLGGIFIGMIEMFGVAYVSANYRDVYVFGLLIIVLLSTRGGILEQGDGGEGLTSSVSTTAAADFRPRRGCFRSACSGRSLPGSRWRLLMQYALAAGDQGVRDAGDLRGDQHHPRRLTDDRERFTGAYSIEARGVHGIGRTPRRRIVYYRLVQALWRREFSRRAVVVSSAAIGIRPAADSGDLLFIGACVAAGSVAAVAGWIVGLPSLRLRGDYLAIVTLGFGEEIVRVVLRGTDARSAAPRKSRPCTGGTSPTLGGGAGLHFPADLRDGVLDLRLGRDHADGRRALNASYGARSSPFAKMKSPRRRWRECTKY